MPKIYTGIKGSYEIYDQSSIILRKAGKNGCLTGESEIYNNVNNIPTRQDRWRIEQLILGKSDYERFRAYN